MLTYIALWISGINDFSGGKMNDEDCLNSASMIYEDFYFLKSADLKLIAKRLKKRKFIRVTGNEIYQEIEVYFDERCKQAQTVSKNESDYNKKNLTASELDNEQLRKFYKDVKDGKELSPAPKDEVRSCDKKDDKNKEAQEYYKKYRENKTDA